MVEPLLIAIIIAISMTGIHIQIISLAYKLFDEKFEFSLEELLALLVCYSLITSAITYLYITY